MLLHMDACNNTSVTYCLLAMCPAGHTQDFAIAVHQGSTPIVIATLRPMQGTLWLVSQCNCMASFSQFPLCDGVPWSRVGPQLGSHPAPAMSLRGREADACASVDLLCSVVKVHPWPDSTKSQRSRKQPEEGGNYKAGDQHSLHLLSSSMLLPRCCSCSPQSVGTLAFTRRPCLPSAASSAASPFSKPQRLSAVQRTACRASTSSSTPAEPKQPHNAYHRQSSELGGSSPSPGDDDRRRGTPLSRWLRSVAKAVYIAFLRLQIRAIQLGQGITKRCRSWLSRSR